MGTSKRKFKSKVTAVGRRVCIVIPFDPNQTWGTKQRHYVRGTINGETFRGSLGSTGTTYFLPLGAAWLRRKNIDIGASVTVILSPEGPLQTNIAPDIAKALAGEPAALVFFESLATFYRNTYIKWIESAKRPPTRSARIGEMIMALKAGKRQR